MRYLLLTALATVLVCGGCDDDTLKCTQDLGEYNGGFHIETQSDVATLAGYTSISGNLIIECPSCTDLSDLICLTSVGGLRIEGNDALTNLDGLSGLTSVGGGLHGGNLYIAGNNSLTNLNGLDGITSVYGGLGVAYNDALTNLDGLSGITSVSGELAIAHNSALPDCEACDVLDQLTSGPNSIYVQYNLNDTCTPVPANCP